ncbi:MAG: hypothetical protein K0R75_931 [Paenibacillaceae bacterium]|nr:hypothetical protein [Paenibacillaceae bacterium]
MNKVNKEEVAAIRSKYKEHCEDFFKSHRGMPFRPGEINYDWNDRGDFTRTYGHSVILFAMRAFYLNEQLHEANQALVELCEFHLKRPQTFFEIHSFHFFSRGLVTLVKFFGPDGTQTPNLLTTHTYEVLLETMWAWASHQSKRSDAEYEISGTWHVEHSENHHIMHLAVCWGFSMILKDHRRYKQNKFEDGYVASDHYQALTDYFREYLCQRASKGMLVEIASPSYSTATLGAVYFLYDFTDDKILKRRSDDFLKLYWALCAQEQIDGVRGGGKTRCYPSSAKKGSEMLRNAAWYYMGIGEPLHHDASLLAFVTSQWQMPDIIIDMALERAKEEYEIVQRPLGLGHPGYVTPPHYRLRTDFGGMVRYSYCTPDFIIGSLMAEARSNEDWTAISSQNRWNGVIFSGHPDARIYPFCEPEGNESHYNQQWAVQKKGTLIAQKLKTSQYSGDMAVWFSKSGLSEPIERDGWILVESAGAFAGVKPVSGGFRWKDGGTGHCLVCEDQWTPVIIEVISKGKIKNLDSFANQLASGVLRFENGALSYRSIYGDRFEFYADYSQSPRINGRPVNYAPDLVYASPFVQSVYDSGVVAIRKDEEILELHFR